MVGSRTAVVASALALLIFQGMVMGQVSTSRISDRPIADEYFPITTADMQKIRKDIRSVQKQIIAANMKLTDTEAVKFWPVYDKYMSELDQIDDAKYALMKQDIDTRGILSDADAERVVEQWAEIDRSVAQLRMKYIPNFRKVLSSKKTALFCQLERHVQMTIDMRLASSLPVIEP